MAIFVRTREDQLPDAWYQAVERAKEKARKFIGTVIAVDQSTSVVAGKLTAVDIDTLWRLKYPYCKLTMRRPVRYRRDGRLDCRLGDEELFFVNKPSMVLTMPELSATFPKIHMDVLGKVRMGNFG